MAKQLEVRLLGELEIRHGGGKLVLPASKKTRALLGYLVATGVPHSRERLCDLLWQGPDDPRAALRWSLTKIRGLLDVGGVARIVADRERIACERRDLTCDLLALRAELAGGIATASLDTLRTVAGRFRGELLEGLDLPDCYAFHQWCVGERETARALRVATLSALVERVDDPEEALRYARARVAIDALTEAAHVALVRILGDLGRRREALDQYEACRRILANELHAKPSAALLQARMRVADAGRPPSEPPARESAAREDRTRALASSPPLPERAAIVGRATELEAIARAVSSARAGEATDALLFVGEPGIGKSRLLEELASHVRAVGGRVLSGRAFEAEMVRPYGAWIDALRSGAIPDIDEGSRVDLAPLLPELGDATGATGDRGRLYDAVTRLAARIGAASPPLALVLDDIQWFDEASAGLLHYVVRALVGARVIVACGARAEELADNIGVQRLVRALERERRVRVLDLAPLDAAATSALAASLGGQIDLARVVVESGGNPLFALEIAGALARGAAPFSESLAGLIGDRLARLDGHARELVPWAAALGHGFDLDTLARATRMAPSELVAGIEELERRGILKSTTPSTSACYDFAHDLVRVGAYRTLSEPRRRLVHLQIARALDRGAAASSTNTSLGSDFTGVDGALAGDVAHHAALGGDSALAARAYVSAAQRCLRIFANDEAIRLADRGMQHLLGLDRPTSVALRLALLQVHVLSGRWLHRARALNDDLSRAIIDAQDAGLHAAAAEGLHTLSIMQHDGGDFLGARDSSIRAADASRAADPQRTAKQLANSARCLAMLENDMPQAKSMIAEAIALAGSGDAELVHLDWARGLLNAFDGDYDAARAHLGRVVAASRRDEERWAEFDATMRLVLLELELGRPDAALAGCAELTPVAAKMGEGTEGPAAEALEALARVALGEATAEPRLERALDALREVDAKGMLAYVLTLAAEIDRGRGAIDRARARAEQALSAAQIVARKSLVALARAVLAEIALASGDRDAARAQVDATRPDLASPHALSARARAAIERVAAALDSSSITPPPKQKPRRAT